MNYCSKIEQILNNSSYPGRGFIIGLTPDGNNLAIAYYITGRSENSKNRKLVFQKNSLKTAGYKNKIKNENLVIYRPIVKFKNNIIISNGNQTETILNSLKENRSFFYSINKRNFEDDPPIFTPRISALINLQNNKFTYKIAIIKSLFKYVLSTQRHFFCYNNPIKGTGHLIQTYKNDICSNVQSFQGEPIFVKIENNQMLFHRKIWNSLNSCYKISLFTEFINLYTKKCVRKIENSNF